MSAPAYGIVVQLTLGLGHLYAECPHGCIGGDGRVIRTMVDPWGDPPRVGNMCGCYIAGSATPDTVSFYPKPKTVTRAASTDASGVVEHVRTGETA